MNLKKKMKKLKMKMVYFLCLYHSFFSATAEMKLRHRKHIFYEYRIKWLKLNITITPTS